MGLLEIIMELNIQHYFVLERYNTIFHRIKYLTRLKSGISFVVSHNYAIINIDSDYDLPLEKNIDFKLMLSYLLSQVLIKIKISTNKLYS